MLGQTEIRENIDANLIQRTLIPYTGKGTAYLKTASILSRSSNIIDNTLKSNEHYIVKGEFSIGESCYIDSTGHFNAVEFNICYNQLFYVAIAHACSKRLLSSLQDLTLDQFYVKQLPNIYITYLESHYKRVIDSSHFIGILKINKTKRMRKRVIFKTEIEFLDYNEGLAYGKVNTIIT
ncbi:MAG: hypothetical protein F6K16_37115 [Symploca sp. SIO2B6]|nr:hypothetical protein [Symploca sp. SIO2B6]